MSAIDPIEVAHGLMLAKARSVSELEVTDELGEFPESSALSGAEFDALVQQVLDEIRTADIEIGGA